jgi:hypothetical protein
MSWTTSTSALTLSVHRSLSGSRPEIEFVFRTLLTIAGLPFQVSWIETGAPSDIYYGPAIEGISPSVWIPASGRAFSDAPTITARALQVSGPFERLILDGVNVEPRGINAGLVFEDDIVFASYWLLTGAREPFLPRSPVDDLDLEDSPILRGGVLDVPLVSIWGSVLREHFRTRGREPMPTPWALEGQAAFAFTHDVDYPELIRWIEAPRQILRGRGGLAWRILTGRSTYWTFDEWVVLERELGARPCFYFMARQGSLLQYAMGTPDDFYDVRTSRFSQLFRSLQDAGAEIGLHASFHAHRAASTIRAEIDRLQAASGVSISGNRHHYWHLDPDAPNTTLARHAEAGLQYDSSLGFEYYPGFRRGICHPFQPFDPATRKMIDTVQLPPAWMDDHFGRRLAKNGILDPADAGRRLVAVAARTGGIVVVDYHSRGMNREVYPEWGEWLGRFAHAELPGRVSFRLPHEIASMYRAQQQQFMAPGAGRVEA